MDCDIARSDRGAPWFVDFRGPPCANSPSQTREPGARAPRLQALSGVTVDVIKPDVLEALSLTEPQANVTPPPPPPPSVSVPPTPNAHAKNYALHFGGLNYALHFGGHRDGIGRSTSFPKP